MQPPDWKPQRRLFGMTPGQAAFLGLLGLLTFAVVIGGGWYVLRDSGLLDGGLPFGGEPAAPPMTEDPTQEVAEAPPTQSSDEGVGLPPAWTPTPGDNQPETTQSPEPTLDTSRWVLNLGDLPQGFERVTPEELGFSSIQEVFGEEFPLETDFAFVYNTVQDFEFVFGITFRLETAADQADFDADMDDPDTVLAALIEGLTVEEVVDEGTLPGMDDIGDTSVGATVIFLQEGVTWRLDFASFRRQTAGAFVMTMYPKDNGDLISVGEAARKLDGHIAATLP